MKTYIKESILGNVHQSETCSMAMYVSNFNEHREKTCTEFYKGN